MPQTSAKANSHKPSLCIKLFENKIDHATYFGLNNEYIEGIHMLPINPSSAYTRTARFVREEWDAYFGPNGSCPVTAVEGGWRGILYANLAIIDPQASWAFFAQADFDPGWIDGGATRTWYLAYAAGKFTSGWFFYLFLLLFLTSSSFLISFVLSTTNSKEPV